MRGQVLGVDARTGDGIVTGEDGARYRFGPDDWADRGEPVVGMQVDFEQKGDRALGLFPVPGSTSVRAAAIQPPALPTDRNKLVAALIAFFIGTFGIHRFYLGRTGSGFAMLALTCTVVGMVISIPWALVDTVRYLIMSDAEFAERYARPSR